MPGVIIFDPVKDSVGFSTGTDQAVGSYLDIEEDALYFTDTVNIFKWEGNPVLSQTLTWKSGKIRLPKKINMGAVLVEADSYINLSIKLFADGVLITTVGIADGEPHRLPGGYLSNLYEIEAFTTDTITGISIAENIFDLAAG